MENKRPKTANIVFKTKNRSGGITSKCPTEQLYTKQTGTGANTDL